MSGGEPLPPAPGLVWAPPLGWVTPEGAAAYAAARAEVDAWPEAVREAKAAELWGRWFEPNHGRPEGRA